MSIGETLRRLRVNMGRTLVEQSDALGVTANTISRWENGVVEPRKSTLRKLSNLYNVPIYRLIDGTAGDCDDSHKSREITIEQQILIKLEKLSESERYQLLGYIECLCVKKDIEII